MAHSLAVLDLIAENEGETFKMSPVQDLLKAIMLMGRRLWVWAGSPNLSSSQFVHTPQCI